MQTVRDPLGEVSGEMAGEAISSFDNPEGWEDEDVEACFGERQSWDDGLGMELPNAEEVIQYSRQSHRGGSSGGGNGRGAEG